MIRYKAVAVPRFVPRPLTGQSRPNAEPAFGSVGPSFRLEALRRADGVVATALSGGPGDMYRGTRPVAAMGESYRQGNAATIDGMQGRVAAARAASPRVPAGLGLAFLREPWGAQ